MLNKLLAFVRKYNILQPGDHVVCAVSGGADSIALLYAFYLLADKLQITVSAAHFNHGLRGEESNTDQQFVQEFCQKHHIPLKCAAGEVVHGKKGLEAAARNARYAFLKTLPGKIATAHTADDNAETVLMHIVRGTGLKGMGAISPINGNIIRPMLGITREDVLAFTGEYHLRYVNDSSNDTDAFLRNRMRHHVIPLLKRENPKLAENLSAMALRLREDEKLLADMAETQKTVDIDALRQMPQSLRYRVLSGFLEESGVPEPEAEHVGMAEKLVFSDKPSAKAAFPGGVTISRCYQKLEKTEVLQELSQQILSCPGEVLIPQIGIRVICTPAQQLSNKPDCFTVETKGNIIIRSRQAGDTLQRSCGRKSIKALFIDKKIPAPRRKMVPVLTDDAGVLGVYGFGGDALRLAKTLPATEVRFEKT